MIIPFDIVCVGISSVVILNWIGGNIVPRETKFWRGKIGMVNTSPL